MSTPDTALSAAMAAHKAERFDEAEAGYRQVLHARPNDPKALYYLALLHFHRGELDAALKNIWHCLKYAPTHGHALNTLGSMLIAAGRASEAKDAYRRVTEVAPAMGEGWYNLGICQRDEGDVEGALLSLREALFRQPDYFRAYEALASVLYQLGRLDESADTYREWAVREPSNPQARHMVAATSKRNAPQRAADDYVQQLFDRSAAGFDANLARLGYRAPNLVADALSRCTEGAMLAAALDAGCGTGLCGPLVRARCERLVGVDLSTKMLDLARTRAVYDELVAAELGAFMRSRPEAFDAVICADTLVYFGALEEPLRAVHTTLRAPAWFIFTVEAIAAAAAGHGYRLESTGRYAHSEAYLRHALDATNFDIATLRSESLRLEGQQDVPGYLIVARPRGTPPRNPSL